MFWNADQKRNTRPRHLLPLLLRMIVCVFAEILDVELRTSAGTATSAVAIRLSLTVKSPSTAAFPRSARSVNDKRTILWNHDHDHHDDDEHDDNDNWSNDDDRS